MDNNKTAGEEMAQAINMLTNSFYRMKQEQEAKIPAEHRAEYERLMKENGNDKILKDLDDKIKAFREMATNAVKGQ